MKMIYFAVMSGHKQCLNSDLITECDTTRIPYIARYIPSKIIATKLFWGVEADSMKLVFENDQNL